jgi:hypothetical protein
MSRDVFATDPTGRPPDLDVLRRHVTRGWCAFQSLQYALLADRFPATLRHGQLAAQRHEEASASRLRGSEHGGLAAVDRAPPDTWTSSASPPLVER